MIKISLHFQLLIELIIEFYANINYKSRMRFLLHFF